MKKIFLLLIAALTFSCEKSECETFDWQGDWVGFDSLGTVSLSVNDTIAEYCQGGNCTGSGYYLEGNSIVFAGGIWTISEFDCNSVKFDTPQGELQMDRAD